MSCLMNSLGMYEGSRTVLSECSGRNNEQQDEHQQDRP